MHLLSQISQHPSLSTSSSSMSVSGIQGQLLEVTVVGCSKLKDKEWISRQDPYVCVEYASAKFRTTTCTDGGKNPVFQEKFIISLIEGLPELTIMVWNSNTLSFDDFIGSGKVQLQRVLSQGFDDNSWTLQCKSGRYAGEVRLILHFPNFSNASKSGSKFAPMASPYGAPSAPYVPPPTASPYPQPMAYPSAYPSYPTPPPNPTAYPPSPYPPPPQPSAYPPQPYPPAPYPPQPYPPQSYPPPPQASPYYSSGSYPGVYPPPPY